MTALLLAACSDYGLERALPEPAAGPTPPYFDPQQPGHVPAVRVVPSFHDFGEVEPWTPVTQSVTVSNVGLAPLTVTALTYRDGSGELALNLDETVNGPLPWVIAPRESRAVQVTYTPVDTVADEGVLVVESDDRRAPAVEATQLGNGRFDGFATGWYIVDDDTPYNLTSDAAHRVDYDGDPDAYWYEPSGHHGLTDSVDPTADFAAMRSYVIGRAGGTTVVTGPLSFSAASDLPDMMEGSFSYLLCDFWMDAADDPARYAISMGPVDDGVRVIVNGHIIGELTYNQSGAWPLTYAIPGQVNSLLILLMDNAMWEKYAYDIAFYKDGRMVGG